MAQHTKESISARLKGSALSLSGKSGYYVLTNVHGQNEVFRAAKLDQISYRVKVLLGK